MLGRKQRHTIFQLFDIIAELCAEDIDVQNINDIETKVHKVLLVFVERDFPLSMQLIVFHLYTITQCLYIVLDQSTDFGCSLTKGLIRGFHKG